MILIASMGSFLFVFFLCLGVTKMIRAEEEVARKRIANRLKPDEEKEKGIFG